MKKGSFNVTTTAKMELVDITKQLQRALSDSGVSEGICYAYNPHTTAGLTINEGADPAVCDDLIAAFREIVPLDYPFKHLEGNSASHTMTALTGSSLTIFIEEGRLQLGTWQRVFFAEYDGPRNRKVWWKILQG